MRVTFARPGGWSCELPIDSLLDPVISLDAEGRVQDLNPATRKMLRAIESGNAGGVVLAAHTLNGSVGYFGADRAAELAAELEQKGRDNDLQDAPLLLEEMRAEVEDLLTGLQEVAWDEMDA